MDLSAEITCSIGGIDESCGLNVINQAVLSDCYVRYSSNSQTLTGCCRFEHAFSAICPMSCHWAQIDGTNKVNFRETTTSSTLSKYKSGECKFSKSSVLTWYPCQYRYSVLFFPGPAEALVSDGCGLTTTATTTELTTETTTVTTTVTTTETPIRVSLTTSVQGGQEGTAITLQRGQKNVRLTCRYDNTTGWALGLLSWCKTGSSCSKDPGSAGSSSTRQ
ncbi:uncharacterized protein [Littorina saxatilis]|uniref:uncharacterized protein n=1 Tax=Littorina saxatilis TaxID=31220 RepID=UPI0038B632C7